MAISFHFQEVQKPAFFKALTLRTWLKSIAKKEGFLLQDVNYIFVEEEALLEINIKYLQHDTYTDIITFDNSDTKGKIESDIYISIERVEANAQKYNITFENELLRVLAHGLLHLCGYKDKSKKEAAEMRQKEEECLMLWANR
jgi:rRNA maturation RNase YbeY